MTSATHAPSNEINKTGKPKNQSVLFLLAHPNIQESRANRLAGERVQSLERVTFIDLYKEFPNFALDIFSVHRQQELLRQHDVLFIQHPIYWYSIPPLLKLWIDEVFTLGFAYGKGEMALKNKTMQLSVTTGGGPEAYTHGGFHGHNIQEFLLPLRQTAKLTEMHFAEPLVLFSATKESEDNLRVHGERVRDRVMHYTLPRYTSP